MSHHDNITRIKAVYNALGALKNEVVFVGGAAVSLYADRRAEETRPTDDIDVIIELWAHKDYAAIDERLRKMGFINDQESGVICRYTVHGITVDVMPTDDRALGFANKWYPSGFASSVDYSLDEETIRIFSSPYFLASKLEAFLNRGRGDGRASTDFEDIVFVLENRTIIWEEIDTADEEVRQYLKETFGKLMQDNNFEEWVDSHAGFGSPPATYFIIDRLEAFTDRK